MEHHTELDGKLGVYWHTQGAGKSYSMIFFEEKVQRKLSGNWRFIVITDRIDLDQQIYENFASARQALASLSIFPAKPNTFSEEAALSFPHITLEEIDQLLYAGLLESHCLF